jgi:hypothetical protein
MPGLRMQQVIRKYLRPVRHVVRMENKKRDVIYVDDISKVTAENTDMVEGVNYTEKGKNIVKFYDKTIGVMTFMYRPEYEDIVT